MIVISSDLSLGLEDITGFGEDWPVVGYHNAILPTQVSASSAALNHAARLVAYPTTYDYWEAEGTGLETLTFATPGAFDYVGVARHNLGSIQANIRVEGFDGTWEPLSEYFIPADDEPLMIVFERDTRTGYRLALGGGEDVPQLASVYLGNLLGLPKYLDIGHEPIKYSRQDNMSSGRADSGDFLGRIFINQRKMGRIDQEQIPEDYYREKMDAWVRSRNPFFFAWRPSSYPREVAYLWRTGRVSPAIHLPNGMMSLSMQVEGM